MRTRMTSHGRVASKAAAILASIEEMEKKLIADESAELLSDAKKIGDEEAEIAEESTGISVSEVQDQNERANDNWPIEAREAVASRLVTLAKRIMESC